LGAQNPVYNGVLCYGEDYQTIQGWISLNWNG
jgi:hypothetical protein